MSSDLHQAPILTYSSSRSLDDRSAFFLWVAGFLTLAAGLSTETSTIARNSIYGLAVLFVVAGLGGFITQRTIAFNLETRRITVVHKWFAKRPRQVIDCSFDDCIWLGIIERRNGEGESSYGIYFQPKDDKPYTLPSVGDSFEGASTVARALAAATSIRRLDIVFRK